MFTFSVVLCLSLTAALVVIAVLWLSWSNLRESLRCAEADAEMWEQRARESGWKNPMEQALDRLRRSVDVLKESNRILSASASATRKNAVSVKILQNRANEVLRLCQVRNAAPSAAEWTAAERAGQETAEAFQRFLLAGGLKTGDPKKRN